MQPESRVRITEYEPATIANPNVIVGVPEVGLVGMIATSYLVQQLGLPEVGYVDSDLAPQVVVVHESKPKPPIRLFGKGSLIVVLSEIPLSPQLSNEFARDLARWGKAKQSRMIIGASGIPSKDRIEAEERGKPNVFAVTNNDDVSASLKGAGAQLFEEGLIVGVYAMLLKHCIALGQPNLTLLAESHLQFPDPGAAAAIIEVLNRLLPINVEVKPLLEESEEIRLRSRELMSKTQQNMQQMAQAAPGVYT